jgi:hypothetical protein
VKPVEEKFAVHGETGCAEYDLLMDMWRIEGPWMTSEDGKFLFITREMLDGMLDARRAASPSGERG